MSSDNSLSHTRFVFISESSVWEFKKKYRYYFEKTMK